MVLTTLYPLTMRWQFPVLSILFYLKVVLVYNSTRTPKGKPGQKPKPMLVQNYLDTSLIIAIHDAVMVTFSLVIFLVLSDILLRNLRFHSLCDSDFTIYDEQGIGYYIWVFYLSKYYELVDTFLLMMKDKPVTFLHYFHHAGVIITLWLLCSTQQFGAWCFVWLNSLVHILMYQYYFASALKLPEIALPKKVITMAQIAQFALGIFLGVIYRMCDGSNRLVVVHDGLSSWLKNPAYAEFVTTMWFFFYVVSLFFLFYDFHAAHYWKDGTSRGTSHGTSYQHPHYSSHQFSHYSSHPVCDCVSACADFKKQ